MQSSRVLALFGYVTGILFVLVILFSNSVQDVIQGKYFSKPDDAEMSYEEIDSLVSTVKSNSALFFSAVILFDFIFRYFVIETLYQKFKERKRLEIPV